MFQHNKRSTLTAIAIVVTAMLLSACGFALRGAVNFPFASIFIAYQDGTPLKNEIRRNLLANGTTRIAPTAKDAEVVLEIVSETRDKHILAIGGQGRVREYNLNYAVRFRVINAVGKEYLPPNSVSLTRAMTYNEAQALAKESEEALLYRDLQNEAVRQIMRRLAVLKME